MYSTVALTFLEKDVNVWVLLKPCECTGQYGKQAGSICQSLGGSGVGEDQSADGGEEEGGEAAVHYAAQVFRHSRGLRTKEPSM